MNQNLVSIRELQFNRLSALVAIPKSLAVAKNGHFKIELADESGNITAVFTTPRFKADSFIAYVICQRPLAILGRVKMRNGLEYIDVLDGFGFDDESWDQDLKTWNIWKQIVD